MKVFHLPVLHAPLRFTIAVAIQLVIPRVILAVTRLKRLHYLHFSGAFKAGHEWPLTGTVTAPALSGGDGNLQQKQGDRSNLGNRHHGFHVAFFRSS